MALGSTLLGGPALADEVEFWRVSAKSPRLRSLRAFACEEIRIPDGPFAGQRFTVARQPFAGPFLDLVGSRLWREHVVTGPTQTGKTLLACGIPVVYSLFELKAKTGFGVPNLDMANDKWKQDLKPVVRASRYDAFLPSSGPGSRGGDAVSLEFTNGAVLRFFGGGGDDQQRAGWTGPNIVLTENDGFGDHAADSKEADKGTQIVVRAKADWERRWIIREGTLTVAEGLTWQGYTKGTETRLACPCPHCGGYVTPERDHLAGWQNARDEIEARELTSFACPTCGVKLSEDDRRAMNLAVVALHRGQTVEACAPGVERFAALGGGWNGDVEVDAGLARLWDAGLMIVGDVPRTETLGFRWSAFNNFLMTAGSLGVEEWLGSRAADEENAEKRLCQFVWAIPYDEPTELLAGLNAGLVAKRTGGTGKGIVPAGASRVTMGIDVGQYFCHWAAIAWQPNGSSTVIDYGILELHPQEAGVEGAILAGLREARAWILEGFPSSPSASPGQAVFASDSVSPGQADTDDDKRRRIVPCQVWVDAGWKPAPIYQFCHESLDGASIARARFRPSKGHGATQPFGNAKYTRPRSGGRKSSVKVIGEGYHISQIKGAAVPTLLVETDADGWKSWLASRLGCSLSEPGAMTLFSSSNPNTHRTIAKHVTAERQVEKFVAGRGLVVVWETLHKNNHWNDALALACGAGRLAGVRIEGMESASRASSAAPVVSSGLVGKGSMFSRGDGRPFVSRRS